MGSTPGSGRSPGEGNGNPFQSSCLGNSMHTRAWQATVHRVPKRVRHALATKQQQPLIQSHDDLELLFSSIMMPFENLNVALTHTLLMDFCTMPPACFASILILY